jgi:hypothetical protein
MSIFGLSGLRKSLVDKSAAVPQLAGDLAQRTPLSAQNANSRRINNRPAACQVSCPSQLPT